MAISVSKFGDFEGKAVEQFRLKSDTGAEVDLISYGVTVRDWRVPVAGGLRSVVLGFDTLADYVAHSPYFGCVAGRVANRIAGGSFELDGKQIKVDANESGSMLHGGSKGLGRLVWDGKADEKTNSVTFTHFSPDGAMGFPGNVTFTATYTLTGNRLRLEFRATTDRKTPISLVQHQYFNLGTGADVLDHSYRIAASAYTGSENLIPTGAILPVEGTPYDLRKPRTLRDAAGKPVDYDLNLALDQSRAPSDPVAVVASPDKALTLKLWTDRPGVQFYTAVTTNVPVPGLNGRRYGQYSGFCLEDQAYPDAVHHAHFPSVIYSPERPYSHWCEFEIA